MNPKQLLAWVDTVCANWDESRETRCDLYCPLVDKQHVWMVKNNVSLCTALKHVATYGWNESWYIDMEPLLSSSDMNRLYLYQHVRDMHQVEVI